MTDFILLMASGSSRRFGENKLLADFRGQPLYRWTLRLLAELAEKREGLHITVISRYAGIRQEAEALGFSAVDCPESHLGQSRTIVTGIRSLPNPEPEDRLTFLVADQPLLSTASVEKLLDAPPCPTARLFCQGRPGNPVRFSAALIPELLTVTGDQGGGVVLKKHPPTPVEILNPLELADIDTVADLCEYEHSLP